MSPEEYTRLSDLFSRALQFPRDRRAAFVNEHPDVAAQLEALLAEDEREHRILDCDLGSVASDLIAAGQPGKCGPYTLELMVGEGGSGVVYRGRRSDLDSVAAIKVLRDAWISPSRRRRFEREQRTLARLQHPNIATLLDAGVTGDGTPWIAMEFVEGTQVTRFAEERGLDVTDRLHLFQAICAAVQYAHERAVIHRDLKPSNILIDGSGAPRLLDFGIARHLDDTDAEMTRPELRLMTPAYAAPEQIRGEPAGVYTDIHALGVILFELLAGHLPEGGAPPSASSSRTPGPTAWDELDVLCAKAMHADPVERYRSADALSRDIGRYLASEPLEARPESAVYRARKFLVRHRVPVLASALAVLTLAVTGGWFTFQLSRSRDRAVAAAARAERIQTFLMNLFEGGDAAAGPARGLTVEALIDRGVREAGWLDREPAVQGEVYETLGRMYEKLGRYAAAETMLKSALDRSNGAAEAVSRTVELSSVNAEQGNFDRAETLARRAIEQAASSLGPAHDLTLAAQERLGRILTERGTYPAAIAILEGAVARRRTAVEPAALASAASALAAAHFYAGAYDESRRLNNEALAARKRAHGDRHPLVADDWISLGAIEFDTGRYDEAERYYRDALSVKQDWYGDDHPAVASAMTMLGRALVYQKKHVEARVLLERALAIQEKLFGSNHASVASILNDLGNIAVAEENYGSAESHYRRMEEIYRASRGDGHYLVATALSNRANVYLRRGEPAKAETMLRDVVQRYTKALSAEHTNTAIARIRLGRSLVRQKRWRDAAGESRAGYDLLIKQAKAPVSWLQGAREDLAASYTAIGDQQQAARFRSELRAAEGDSRPRPQK